jgi:midasin
MAPAAAAAGIPPLLMAFWTHFQAAAPPAVRGALSVRDLLAWVTFINTTVGTLGPVAAYVHGAYLTLLDGLGLGSGLAAAAVAPLNASCQQLLVQQVPADMHEVVAQAAGGAVSPHVTRPGDAAAPGGTWGLPPFFIPCGSQGGSTGGFELAAPTTARNAFRLLRAMQLRKAVLLEGSPGVGKTSLVTALARAAGVTLVRINLSEHTDMLDLLGADLPAAGGGPGQFTWCDGPLLRALKQGHWVLLDELNLAGQSILEGLNALLDHREQVFVPELGQTFDCHRGFRLFAAQNPLQEGGGRKGLPKSFLNRFTRVAVELLQPQDLALIAGALHPHIPQQLLHHMVLLLGALQQAASPAPAADASWVGQGVTAALAQRVSQAVNAVQEAAAGAFAAAGGPWEFNLRDLLRWCELASGLCSTTGGGSSPAAAGAGGGGNNQQQQDVSAAGAMDWDAAVEHFVPLLLMSRLRTAADRQLLAQLFESVWGRPLKGHSPPHHHQQQQQQAGGALLTSLCTRPG